MKDLSKMAVVSLLVVGLILSLAGCVEDDGGNGGEGGVTIDYTNYAPNHSIMVRNNSSERLVAFVGDLHPDNYIGGIPARSNNHGLKKDTKLFYRTDDFPLILLTEAQYKANINNLNSQKYTPFTRVYIFYNATGDNSIVYEIAEGLGGPNTLRIINTSKTINIELRLGGIFGETIGYAPAGMIETNLKLADGDYNVFPVFKRYNRYRDIVETVYPQGSGSDYAWFQPYSFENEAIYEMNLRALLQNTNFATGAAWIIVRNESDTAGIQFREGVTPRVTPSGMRNVMTGQNIYFQIDMPKVGNVFGEKITATNWSFGPGINNATLASTDIYAGKLYTVTITGDHNQGPLIAAISEGVDIPQDELAGEW